MRQEFDNYASNYEELLKDPLRDCFTASGGFFHERKWILIEQFFRSAGINSGNLSWLDVGCGKGELLRLGKAKFRQVAGCDPSPEMLAESSGLELRIQSDPMFLPFEDQSFDFVTAVCVYHHIEPADRLPFTKEVAAKLAPGGVFCMIEHNPFNPVTQMIVRRTPVDANAKLLTARVARKLCREVGLMPIHSEYFLYFPEKVYHAFPHEGFLASIPFGGQYAVFGRKA